MEAVIFERKIRPTGEPPRCSVCGTPCEQSFCGPVLCGTHMPREQGSGTRRHLALAAARQERTRRRAEALPVASRTAAIPTLGERLRARRASENGGER